MVTTLTDAYFISNPTIINATLFNDTCNLLPCCFYVCIDKCTTQSYYYLGFLYNDRGGSESFVLTTTASQPVDYSVYIPRHNYRNSGKVTSINSVTLSLPYNMEASLYSHTDYGIYLETSSDKVTVIGQNYHSSSSDTYLALPIIKSQTATEYVYYIMSVYSPNSCSTMLIVASEDTTTGYHKINSDLRL